MPNFLLTFGDMNKRFCARLNVLETVQYIVRAVGSCVEMIPADNERRRKELVKIL